MFYGLLCAFSALIVVLDQVSKYLTVTHFAYPYPTDLAVWPGVFHLTRAHNEGMSFSMLQGGRWFFIAVTILFLGLIVYAVWKKWFTNRVSLWCLAAVVGGALGNFIDRLLHGYVVDMIEVEFISFPVFNLADSCIVCGAILLVIVELFFAKKPKEEAGHDTDG